VLYFFPQFSRLDLGLIRAPGSGLGNLLYPWARSLIYAGRTGGIQIAPTWRNLKLGPILRNEPDKRIYGDLVHHRGPAEVWRGLRLRLTLPATSEDEFLRSPDESGGDRLVRVTGMRDEFAPLLPHRAEIRRALFAVARKRPEPRAPFVAAHVRTGDFAAPTEVYRRNSRIALDWYAAEIERVSRALALDTVVFTDDASGRVRAELGAIPGVRIAEPVNSLTDILSMSQARHVVCANSTFSLWAAFLCRGTVSTRFPELFADYRLDDIDGSIF
jgi:hypothetical protein